MLSVLMMFGEDNIVKRPINDKIILDVADGDTDALHELYEQTSNSVYGFALSITKNSHDAEDVLQETFLSVYQTAPNYKPCGKPMAWVLTIAKNKALSKLRAADKTEELDDSKASLDDKLSLSLSSENKLIVESLLSQLSSQERQIVVLHAVSGLRHREISVLLDMPTGTVLSKYNRAIKKLKNILKGER